jgi:hypothetical protein
VEYRRLLAVLEQEINKPQLQQISSSVDQGRDRISEFQSSSNPSNTHPSSSSSTSSGLTLLRLKAWMAEPTERMFLMARLVDCASSLTGGALASRLHSHSRHGDLSSSLFVQRVMDSVCAPIFSMLAK